MRTVLNDRREVAHFWANKVQSEGRAGNMFFADSKLWSYGHHFCIARHLPNDTVALTTRGYSPSTGQHIFIARQAARHLKIVFCHDPDATASANRDAATAAMEAEITAAQTTRRIHQKTRDAHKLSAVLIGQQFNEYLDALPEEERGYTTPIPVDDGTLEKFEEWVANKNRKEAEEKEARIKASKEKAERAQSQWRANEALDAGTGHILHNFPPILRVSADSKWIETSHGARIATHEAVRLWPVIVACKKNGKTWKPESDLRVSGYPVNQVTEDGTLIVGCHTMAFSEIESIARQLKLIG